MIFSMFFITHATFFTIIIIVIISLVTPLCYPFSRFPSIFFLNFIFYHALSHLLSYILLPIVSKGVHIIAKIA